MRVVAALAVDAALVVLFAASGRSAHAETTTLAGTAGTAWPFLVGVLLGWGLVRRVCGAWPLLPKAGGAVWASALVVGMGLRLATGQGTDPAFVLVAAVVLAAFLVGWRAAAEVGRFTAEGLGRWSARAGRQRARGGD